MAPECAFRGEWPLKLLRKFTAVLSVCSLSLFSFNFQQGELSWQVAANANASSGTGAGSIEGEYTVKDVPSGDGGEVESALNMTMLLMLAAAGVAIYAEMTCPGLTSIHIYAGTAAGFVAGYLFQISSLSDEIDEIISRYKDFNFSTSTALDGVNRDMQIEAYRTCQQENKTVAEHLRSIAMLHYMVALGFAAAAAWAMFMEGTTATLASGGACPKGLGCGGICSVAFVEGESQYHNYAYLDVEMFFNGQMELNQHLVGLGATFSQSKEKGAFASLLSKLLAQLAPIRNLEPSLSSLANIVNNFFIHNAISQAPPSYGGLCVGREDLCGLSEDLTGRVHESMIPTVGNPPAPAPAPKPVTAPAPKPVTAPAPKPVAPATNSPQSATTTTTPPTDPYPKYKAGETGLNPSTDPAPRVPGGEGEAARASQAGKGPLAEKPAAAPDKTAPTGEGAPGNDQTQQASKDDAHLLDKYWVRALIFAGFAVFSYFVGSMYDENAEIYDARAAACAELEQKLQEASDTLPGIKLEEGPPVYETSQYLPGSKNNNKKKNSSYHLVAEFFQEIAWQLQQAQAGMLAQMIPNALANSMPALENRTCFIAGNRRLPEKISCQACAEGARCMQPKIMSYYQERNNLPWQVNQNIKDLGQYEYLLYSGQPTEAMKVVKKLAAQKQETKDELEKMINHFMPQMVASGAPNLPYNQLMARYQEEVKKMGQDYLNKLSASERRDFISRFALPKTSTHFNAQLAQMLKEQEPFAPAITNTTLSVEERNWAQVASPADGSEGVVAAGSGPTAVDPQALRELIERADISLRSEQSIFQIISRRYQRAFGGD